MYEYGGDKFHIFGQMHWKDTFLIRLHWSNINMVTRLKHSDIKRTLSYASPVYLK